MRSLLSVLLVLSSCHTLFAQQPRLFTEKLGNHPQFPFLQYEKGVTTRAAFLQAVRDPQSRSQYPAQFSTFDTVLHDLGFPGGYRSLKSNNIENVFINPGAIGRLGFFNKASNYIYVKLNPAGEGDDGIAAWKITGPGGRYVHILHTCGNAFIIDGQPIREIPCPCDSGKNKDTVVIRDTVVKRDTLYQNGGPEKAICQRKWEITLDGGASFNSIPRYDNTRTNGAQPAAELTVSRILQPWLQAGISVSYLTLSYQDDLSGNTWTTVYPAKPVIPLQLFVKANIVGPGHWQANTSLSAGYGLITKGTAKSGPTAGLKMGVTYFVNCRWGLGVSATGQYFNNKLFALPVTGGLRYRF